METRVGTIALVALAMLMSVGLVLADPTAPINAPSVQASSSRDLSGLTAQSVQAQGGNVTQVNIDALTITQSWTGYYGDVSGEITLDNGAGDTFYNWSVTRVTGEVYATRNSSVTWSTIICANSTHFGQEESYLGQVAADGDSVSNTFNLQQHPALSVGSRTLTANSCNSTYAFESSASQSTNWVQILLHQNDTKANNTVYATIINDTTTGFDGNNYDFQLLVGENEHAGSLGTTTYYFWVELG